MCHPQDRRGNWDVLENGPQLRRSFEAVFGDRTTRLLSNRSNRISPARWTGRLGVNVLVRTKEIRIGRDIRVRFLHVQSPVRLGAVDGLERRNARLSLRLLPGGDQVG